MEGRFKIHLTTINVGVSTKEFLYSYDANCLKKSFAAPDGTVYEYVYGSNNELREVRIPGLGLMTISEYQWNRPKTMLYPGGSKREYDYDALMRLTRLVATDPGGNSLLDYSYDYDTAGNIVSKITEHGTYSYGYDGTSRLTSVDNPTLDDEAYSYDVVGNRTAASNAVGNISHNANNELVVYGDVEYVYDANGNMTKVQLAGQVMFSYHYNAENRLVKVEGGNNNTIAEYFYDPFGRRLWKEVSGTRTYFFSSDEGLIAEYDAAGTELKSYGYKPDSTWTTDPLFLKDGGSYYFYQNDHLGTPQKLIAQNGAVVWSVQYSAFGEASIEIETVTNNLRFPGQYFDVETSLHYNFQRYYDPGIGRYVSVDPIGFEGGDANWYAYALDNPIGVLDPFGLQCHKVRLVFNADHYKDRGTFEGAAARLEDAYNRRQEKDVTVIKEFAKTGQEIVDIINEQEKNSIISLDIFSHANPFGIHISRKLKEPVPHWPYIPTEPLPDRPYIPSWAPVRPGGRANPWGFLKPRLHAWLRDYPEEEGKEMEESYHGLYTDIFGALAVGVYFNQQWGEGIATLGEIRFSLFSEDANVEFHGCLTAHDYTTTFGPVTILWNTNFASSFSSRLGNAGKTQAEVTGHVTKEGIQGQSYQHGHRLVYKDGKVIRVLH